MTWSRCRAIGISAALATAAEATEMTAFEDFVQEKVMEGRSILGLYPATDAFFTRARYRSLVLVGVLGGGPPPPAW